MPSAIAAFPSKQYYGDSLVSCQPFQESPPDGFDWPSNDPIAFVNVYSEDGHEKGPGEDSTSISNMTEARLVADIVADFHKFGGKPTPSISVVTFYSRQVQVIESQLRAKRADGAVSWVKTAESAQGLEEDIIIVSLVRSNSFGTLGFVKDFRRLNVAMTRAKLGLILVGDYTTLMQRDLLGTWSPFFRMFKQND